MLVYGLVAKALALWTLGLVRVILVLLLAENL